MLHVSSANYSEKCFIIHFILLAFCRKLPLQANCLLQAKRPTMKSTHQPNGARVLVAPPCANRSLALRPANSNVGLRRTSTTRRGNWPLGVLEQRSVNGNKQHYEIMDAFCFSRECSLMGHVSARLEDVNDFFIPCLAVLTGADLSKWSMR